MSCCFYICKISCHFLWLVLNLFFNAAYVIILFFSPPCFSLQDSYLVYILNELAGNSFMVFCSTCNNTQRTALLLRNLGFTAIPLHGQMSQVWAYPTERNRQESCLLGNGLYHTESQLPCRRSISQLVDWTDP